MLARNSTPLGSVLPRRAAKERVMSAGRIDFQGFFDEMPVAIHILGDDATLLYANKAELDLLGYPAQDYIGRHIAEFHADQDVIGDILTQSRKRGKHTGPSGEAAEERWLPP